MSDNQNSILMTPQVCERLKAALKAAKENGAATFVFDGHEFVTQYAAYMVEYVEGEFAKRAKQYRQSLN